MICPRNRPLRLPAKNSSKELHREKLDIVDCRQLVGYRPLRRSASNERREPGSELFVFDLTPPRQYVGFEAYKKDWENFFAAFPGPVDRFEVQDLSIVTGDKVAYSHSIQPGVMTAKDGSKFNLTARVSDCYRKINGKWLITQEHVSVPVDIDTGKLDFASKP